MINLAFGEQITHNQYEAMSVRLSALVKHDEFHQIFCACWPWWRRCGALLASGFMDDVIFLHTAPYDA